jgi:hypothetical protein
MDMVVERLALSDVADQALALLAALDVQHKAICVEIDLNACSVLDFPA